MKHLETYISLTRTILPVPALKVMCSLLSINGHQLLWSVLEDWHFVTFNLPVFLRQICTISSLLT